MKDSPQAHGQVVQMSSKQSQFDALVRATSTDLYRFAYWLCHQQALAEDLVQETYLRAWKSIDHLRDTNAAKAWLITILRREHARLYEKKTPAIDSIDDVVIEDTHSVGPEQSGEARMIRRAMAQLDKKYREPLLMQVIGGFSCEEIAKELDQSKASVMTQLFRARQKLKGILDGDKLEAQVHELH